MSTVTVTQPTRTTWTLDPAHTSVEFSVRHLMITTVKGRFAGVAGTVVLDEADPTASAADVTIDAASVDTRVEQRDAHLRSADFLDVDRYPVITFKTRRVTPATRGSFQVVGDLTIHGVSREVVLDARAEGRAADPWGGQRAAFSATTKIKRSDYGLTWNQALEAGGVVVGDELTITLDAQLIQQAEAVEAA